MGTVTGLSAERMLEIEAETIIGGSVVDGHFKLHRKDGGLIDMGAISGVAGPPGLGVRFLDPAESSASVPDGTKICRRYI